MKFCVQPVNQASNKTPKHISVFRPGHIFSVQLCVLKVSNKVKILQITNVGLFSSHSFSH